jgi:anaerobic selenocysteine-containing dehydrogenase
MLHQLQEAAKRGVPIVTFNPLRERGLEEFTNPQSPLEMLSGSSTRITSRYHQVRSGGDTAAIMGIAKALLALEEKGGAERVIDHEFVREHTHGFDEFVAAVTNCDWPHIERRSGLTRSALEAAAFVYARAKSVMFIYGMGLTQHEKGVETVQTMVNLALMRGNIGRPGACICPVRGHSNVQGQRTVGITEKPDLVPAEKIKALFGIEVPQKRGLTIVEACEAASTVRSARSSCLVAIWSARCPSTGSSSRPGASCA